MVLQVQTYAARKAEERPVRFLGDREYVFEEVSISGMGRKPLFTKAMLILRKYLLSRYARWTIPHCISTDRVQATFGAIKEQFSCESRSWVTGMPETPPADCH
jgi:hypothetical protein